MTEYAERKEPVLTAMQVQEIIPNRFPISFVDRVDEIIPGEKVVARKNVTINEEFFVGHFPGNPVMPGVLQVETMAQVGSIPLLSQPDFKNKIAYLAGLNNVKFRKNVVPGDVLEITVEIVKLKKRMGIGKGTIRNEYGEVCSEAEMTFIISNVDKVD
ncbi:3-hydroxyacyl-ACP dehydratase FabZ [Aerococcus urinaeequi]|uniref:3-hydroxyacyl-[acyl-carrier-protein] dehydratase n=3 Tax=Aerococcus TaxID=1375 RepID=A0A2J9PPT2_9LACT|nr:MULTISPECIES: 3-hydroxyacyl-ACP dehydratase FabZ [Lactobacillales]KAF3303172.1 3-hydroxyacyl-ACP dehydratase FabZ [Carnobacterium sp. PL17RED31]ALZ87906.1 3-hydroxyacyl-[acyl-carrier-protein] dehydratase FabZ [Aerococcus urinaeequi]AMC00953.1 3-hydroxyacyl-[acyl-carrier-protein] dehydratase FabZ [Aerococcus viridans]EFG49570.1 putative beta-hydroxyacyl-(acyl-carrier-protein) dehydratase FabZ [Aerococcus viridans ATCC 11563 = CCUG 4311]KAF3299628.1 3-hydroxyacyl-ACP dehydratase FabZ [Carnoba